MRPTGGSSCPGLCPGMAVTTVKLYGPAMEMMMKMMMMMMIMMMMMMMVMTTMK